MRGARSLPLPIWSRPPSRALPPNPRVEETRRALAHMLDRVEPRERGPRGAGERARRVGPSHGVAHHAGGPVDQLPGSQKEALAALSTAPIASDPPKPPIEARATQRSGDPLSSQGARPLQALDLGGDTPVGPEHGSGLAAGPIPGRRPRSGDRGSPARERGEPGHALAPLVAGGVALGSPGGARRRPGRARAPGVPNGLRRPRSASAWRPGRAAPTRARAGGAPLLRPAERGRAYGRDPLRRGGAAQELPGRARVDGPRRWRSPWGSCSGGAGPARRR